MVKELNIGLNYGSGKNKKRKEGFPKEWFDEDVARVDEIQADLKEELYKDDRKI